MFSLIFADNSFWRYEHFIFSMLSGGCIYYLYICLNKFDNLRPDIANEYKAKKLALTVAMGHLTLQFLYHFVYNLAIIEYASRLTFILILIYLNQNFLGYQKSITEEQKSQLKNITQVFVAFILFVAFLSILNAKSENSCGQNLYALYIFIYLCIAGASMLNSYQNLKTISSDISFISDNNGQMNATSIGLMIKLLDQLSELRMLFYHFVFAVMSSCIIGMIILYLKYHSLNSTVFCKDLYLDKGFLFKVVFAVFEFAIVNSLNGFIYYHYFWKFRKDFEFKKELVERVTNEAFNHDRSIMIEHEKGGLAEN